VNRGRTDGKDGLKQVVYPNNSKTRNTYRQLLRSKDTGMPATTHRPAREPTPPRRRTTCVPAATPPRAPPKTYPFPPLVHSYSLERDNLPRLAVLGRPHLPIGALADLLNLVKLRHVPAGGPRPPEAGPPTAAAAAAAAAAAVGGAPPVAAASAAAGATAAAVGPAGATAAAIHAAVGAPVAAAVPPTDAAAAASLPAAPAGGAPPPAPPKNDPFPPLLHS